MALARAEAAVQVRRLAAARLHGLLNEAQRVAEGFPSEVSPRVAQRLVGVRQAFRPLEHEVALVHPLRDMNQVLQQRHSQAPCMRFTSGCERVLVDQPCAGSAGLGRAAFLTAGTAFDV